MPIYKTACVVCTIYSWYFSGEVSNASNFPSPNTNYKELDKSIDWRDLMGKGFKQRGLAKGLWVSLYTRLGIIYTII